MRFPPRAYIAQPYEPQLVLFALEVPVVLAFIPPMDKTLLIICGPDMALSTAPPVNCESGLDWNPLTPVLHLKNHINYCSK